jgi:hypothetical protein
MDGWMDGWMDKIAFAQRRGFSPHGRVALVRRSRRRRKRRLAN